MEGYDTAVLNNIIGLQSFREHFGYDTGKLDNPEQRYQLSAAWQTAVGQAPSIGCFVGIFIASWAQDRWGYKRTIQVALICLTGFIFINFFAVNVQMLFVGELLCGLPWGAFSSSAVSYASDVTPIPLRGYLTTYVNLCCCGHPEGRYFASRQVGLQGPLRHPVDLGHSPLHRRPRRPRVALVPRP